MRERLIELVNKAKEEYANDVTDHTETDYIVECLLDNGVIVPPCNVGDTIYRIVDQTYKERIWEWQIAMAYVHPDEVIYIDDSENEFTKKDIGKTVFLTREEAEAELERRNK